MLGWRDVMMIQARTKDLLREAEQERLAQQALAGRERAVWEKAKELFLGFTQTNSATKEGASNILIDVENLHL